MSEGPPERDPLADLVARSIGTRVESVVAEDLGGGGGVERQRLRFTTRDGDTTLIFERGPRGATLEAQLLPFLARRTDRVPAVRARGLPPPHAEAGPWVLMEDVLAAPDGCAGDPGDVIRAKLAIERAVADAAPALRGLGVPTDPTVLPEELAGAPRGLVHGDLRCGASRRVARGIVIVGWSGASLGRPVLDVAHLLRELERDGRRSDAARVRDTYVAESAVDDADVLLEAAVRYLSTREGR